MTVSAVALVLMPVFGAAVAPVAVALWPTIMAWVRSHLLPWVEQHMAWLADDVRTGVQQIDEAAVQTRRSVQQAWQRLRRVLLQLTAELVKRSDGEWAIRVTSWVVNRDQSTRPYTKFVTERTLRWDELPALVRATALTEQRERYLLDVTDAQDQVLCIEAR